MRASILLLCAALACGALMSPAHADIYAYADSAGGMHYSNVPTDQRYLLILTEPRDPPPARKGPVMTMADWQRRGAAFSEMIDATARRAQLQPALLRAVIAIESAFDPQALSPKGAQGLMQLRPATARRYGVAHPFDPAQNLRGGARYLSDLLKRYGNDLHLALAAYNAGEDAVDRNGRAIPPFPETQAYVPAVMKLYLEFMNDLHSADYTKTLPPYT